MPFFDIASASLFVPFEGVLGTNALTLFSLLISCVGLVGFSLGSRRLFSNRIALFATIMFAFYPKLVVMSARGMPEAAAVGFLGLMLAPIGKGIDTNSTRQYVYAGIWAVSAYLMYMPAVLAGIVTTSYLFLRKVQKSPKSIRSLILDLQIGSFAMPSFVTGIFYLWYGPVATALSATSGSTIGFGSRELFVRSYGLIERVLRYVGYSIIDFWWHQRGWDAEIHILSRISRIRDFLDPVFLPAAIIWVVTALLLTGLVVTGVGSLLQKRSLAGYWIVAWIGMFIALYNIKNIGWTGAFMTRQVSPLLPAICISFGVGAASIIEKSDMLSRSTHTYHPNITLSSQTLMAIFVCAMLIGLLTIGGIHGLFTAKDAAVTENEVQKLQQTVGTGSDIAVIGSYTYYRTVLYSHGDLRPTVLLDPDSKGEYILYYTEAADVQFVGLNTVTEVESEYIFIIQKCSGYNAREQRFINQLTIVYEHQIQSTGCDTSAILMRTE